MAYTTIDDVRLALADLGTGTDTAVGLDDTTLEAAISDGDAELDGWLCSRYVTPVVDPLWEPLHRWATTFAAWYATLTYRKGKDLEATDPVQLRKLAVLEILRRVVDGVVDLPLPGVDTDPGGATVHNVWCGDLFDPTDWLPGEPGYPPHTGQWSSPWPGQWSHSRGA